MKKTLLLLLLPQFLFILFFSTKTPTIACEVALQNLEGGSAPLKKPPRAEHSRSQEFPSPFKASSHKKNVQHLENPRTSKSRSNDGLILSSLDSDALKKLSQTQFGPVEVQGRMAELIFKKGGRKATQEKAVQRQHLTELLNSSPGTTLAILHQHQPPSQATYQLFCNKKLVPNCQTLLVSFSAK